MLSSINLQKKTITNEFQNLVKTFESGYSTSIIAFNWTNSQQQQQQKD